MKNRFWAIKSTTQKLNKMDQNDTKHYPQPYHKYKCFKKENELLDAILIAILMVGVMIWSGWNI